MSISFFKIPSTSILNQSLSNLSASQFLFSTGSCWRLETEQLQMQAKWFQLELRRPMWLCSIQTENGICEVQSLCVSPHQLTPPPSSLPPLELQPGVLQQTKARITFKCIKIIIMLKPQPLQCLSMLQIYALEKFWPRIRSFVYLSCFDFGHIYSSGLGSYKSRVLMSTGNKLSNSIKLTSNFGTW